MNLVLNNLQRLICHKTQTNKHIVELNLDSKKKANIDYFLELITSTKFKTEIEYLKTFFHVV